MVTLQDLLQSSSIAEDFILLSQIIYLILFWRCILWIKRIFNFNWNFLVQQNNSFLFNPLISLIRISYWVLIDLRVVRYPDSLISIIYIQFLREFIWHIQIANFLNISFLNQSDAIFNFNFINIEHFIIVLLLLKLKIIFIF